jgi:hypothetical protein
MIEVPKELTVAIVLNLLAVITSLLCNYFPGLREWFAAKDGANKALFQIIVVTVICLLAGILTWTGVWLLIPAGRDGVLILFVIWGTSLMSNQTTYSYTRKSLPPSVIAVKALRSPPDALK